MVKKDYEVLGMALQAARIVALNWRNEDDGGTCNFDTPILFLKNTSENTLKALFGEEYGVSQRYKGAYAIGFKILEGQGYRRTRMAEAFAKALSSYGFEAYVYYVID